MRIVFQQFQTDEFGILAIIFKMQNAQGGGHELFKLLLESATRPGRRRMVCSGQTKWHFAYSSLQNGPATVIVRGAIRRSKHSKRRMVCRCFSFIFIRKNCSGAG